MRLALPSASELLSMFCRFQFTNAPCGLRLVAAMLHRTYRTPTAATAATYHCGTAIANNSGGICYAGRLLRCMFNDGDGLKSVIFVLHFLFCFILPAYSRYLGRIPEEAKERLSAIRHVGVLVSPFDFLPSDNM